MLTEIVWKRSLRPRHVTATNVMHSHVYKSSLTLSYSQSFQHLYASPKSRVRNLVGVVLVVLCHKKVEASPSVLGFHAVPEVTYSSALLEASSLVKGSEETRMRKRTVVVNGVPHGEDSEDGRDQRESGLVAAVEELALETTSASGGLALGELGVELDQWGQSASGRSTALFEEKKRSKESRQLSCSFTSSSAFPRGLVSVRLTRMEGEAILGGTMLPSWRRATEACMVVNGGRREGWFVRLHKPINLIGCSRPVTPARVNIHFLSFAIPLLMYKAALGPLSLFSICRCSFHLSGMS